MIQILFHGIVQFFFITNINAYNLFMILSLFLCCRLLLVDREECRCGESLFMCCFKPVTTCCPRFMSVPVPKLARAMINVTITPNTDKVVTLENEEIHKVAEGMPVSQI